MSHHRAGDVRRFVGQAAHPDALRRPPLAIRFLQNPTLRNFEPRVGFAWDPFHNGKISVRAGFGLFDILPLAYEYSNFANNSAPFAPAG